MVGNMATYKPVKENDGKRMLQLLFHAESTSEEWDFYYYSPGASQ
jgi:hypothetical protein